MVGRVAYPPGDATLFWSLNITSCAGKKVTVQTPEYVKFINLTSERLIYKHIDEGVCTVHFLSEWEVKFCSKIK